MSYHHEGTTSTPAAEAAAESVDEFSNDEDSGEEEDAANDEPPFPPMYESGEDVDKAADLKMTASDLKSNGDYEGALAKYTEAVQAAEPSALLYANRADCLLKVGRPRAAINDCDAALKMNPDSAKALRIRGTAKKEIGEYEAALTDLSASQTIDYNDQAAEDLKFCSEKHVELEKENAKKRNKEEEKLRKKAADIKKAQEEAKREAAAASSSASASAGGMGGSMPGGMPGGMAGMMGGLMDDPEIAAGLQNPKVQEAMMGMMSGGGPDPAKMMELMQDPEVGPVMQKVRRLLLVPALFCIRLLHIRLAPVSPIHILLYSLPVV